MDITTLLIAMSIPSSITGFAFWIIEHRIQKREEKSKEERKRLNEADKEERRKRQAEVDARETAKEKNNLYMLKSIHASIALSEATARAVQRIPDAHCNGDMHQALEYAEKIKHEQKDFLNEQALKAIN